MTTLTELRTNRHRAHTELISLLERAAGEHRELTVDEQATEARLQGVLDGTQERFSELDRAEQRQRDAQDTFARLIDQPVSYAGGQLTQAERELDQTFRTAIVQNSRAPITVVPTQRRSGFQPGIEKRALATTSGSGLLGVSFFDRILRHAVDSAAILSAGATVLQNDTGEPIKIPKSTAFSIAGIVAEGATIPASDPTLGSVTLGAFKYGFLVQVSSELANDAAFDLLGFLAEQCGIAIGNGFGAHAITGVGTTQPRGITIDTTLGVTGGTAVAGAFTADNLIDLYHSVAEPYARSASAGWLMRNGTLGAVRKLKDGQQRYLFDINAPAGTGASGTLLGRPVFADPTMPAVALNAKSVVFGDFSKYWVRQVGGIRFERSDEFAFNSDQVTFRCLARLDGALIDTSGSVKHFLGAAS